MVKFHQNTAEANEKSRIPGSLKGSFVDFTQTPDFRFRQGNFRPDAPAQRASAWLSPFG